MVYLIIGFFYLLDIESKSNVVTFNKSLAIISSAIK